jgi:hypothetical protein
MLAAIKLMCSHFLFELEGAKHNVFAVEESQRIVYMATNTYPIYGGPKLTDVNMEWVLHCLHFFRHHMMNEEVATLYDAMSELSPQQKPSAWQEPLRSGSHPLGSHWKGTYAFLEAPEITKLRKLSADQIADTYFCDKNVDEGKIQVCLPLAHSHLCNQPSNPLVCHLEVRANLSLLTTCSPSSSISLREHSFDGLKSLRSACTRYETWSNRKVEPNQRVDPAPKTSNSLVRASTSTTTSTL